MKFYVLLIKIYNLLLADPQSLDLFRRFHCADCLKSFRESHEAQATQQGHHHHHHHQDINNQTMINNSNNINTNNNSILNCQLAPLPLNRTPPPPLQPIVSETLTGLFNYFGTGIAPPSSSSSLSHHNNHHSLNQQLQQQNQQQPDQVPQPPAPMLSSIRLVNPSTTTTTAITNSTSDTNPAAILTHLNSSSSTVNSCNVSNSSSSSILTTVETNSITSMDHDGQIESDNNVVAQKQPQQQQQSQSQPPVFSFGREVTAMSLQEKRHTLSRKLAQRAPKHELVERGILPRNDESPFLIINI